MDTKMLITAGGSIVAGFIAALVFGGGGVRQDVTQPRSYAEPADWAALKAELDEIKHALIDFQQAVGRPGPMREGIDFSSAVGETELNGIKDAVREVLEDEKLSVAIAESKPADRKLPTPEQQAMFDRLSYQIDDPAYHNLTIPDLFASGELQRLPLSMQRQLLSNLVQRVNNGEISPVPGTTSAFQSLKEPEME
jgi:hypothetical protein